MSEKSSTNNLFSTIIISRNDSEIKLPEILFPISNIKNQHEFDTACISCSCKYNVPGLSHTAKHFCHFCYRGTCARCLTHEYYHQEDQKYNQMCASCHSKLTVLSSNFNSEISECQLELAEYRKLIILAEQERKNYQNERINVEKNLSSYKESVFLAKDNKSDHLQELKEEHFKLKERRETAESDFKQADFQLRLIHEQLRSQKQSLEDARQYFYKKHEEVLEQKSCLHEINLKISSLKHEKTEEVLSIEIVSLRCDILEFKHKLNHETQKIEKKKEEKNETAEKITKNQEYLSELSVKLTRLKCSENEILTEDEENRIIDLNNQLKDVNDLIIIYEKRLKHLQEKRPLNFSVSTNRTDLKKANSSESSKEDRNGDTNCCAKCVVY